MSTTRDRNERVRESRCLLTESRLSSELSRMVFMLYKTLFGRLLFTWFYRETGPEKETFRAAARFIDPYATFGLS